jgi:hypothetical protein
VRTLIYLSSAISLGDADYNLYIANAAENRLLQAGYAVINPMRSMLALGAQRALSYENWLDNDFRLIAACDLVCRLLTVSTGAERECEFARSRGIPVVTGSYFACLNDLFEPGSATLCQTDLDNLMQWALFRDREAIRESVLEGFERV